MDNQLARALKAARKQLGLSLRELAKRAGINPMGPSRWERGARPLDLQLPIIAAAYQIPEAEVYRLTHPRPHSAPIRKSDGMRPSSRPLTAPTRKRPLGTDPVTAPAKPGRAVASTSSSPTSPRPN